MNKIDLIIVGSGPAGLTAAIYAGRAGLNVIVAAGSVDNGLLPGGQLMITTEIENYPGVLNLEGPELMENMFQQAKQFGAHILYDWATDFQFNVSKGCHSVKIGQITYVTKSIILANGARARWLNLPDEDKFRNNGVSACATCDGPLPRFRGKDIYVVGGGDTACEEALFLTNFASRVYLVHRRAQLRASVVMASRVLQHAKITVLWNSEIVQYIGNETLTGIIIQDVNTKEQLEVTCAGVFVAIGHVPNTTGLENTELKLSDDGYVLVYLNIHTNIQGVFAAGDNHDTHYRQAITAAGFGCMAGITATHYIQRMD